MLDEIVDALTKERGVDPEVVHEEDLRLYLNTNAGLKLDGAIALWRKGRISSPRVAEVAGLPVPELKEVLAARRVIRETEGKRREKMDAKLTEIGGQPAWPNS